MLLTIFVPVISNFYPILFTFLPPTIHMIKIGLTIIFKWQSWGLP